MAVSMSLGAVHVSSSASFKPRKPAERLLQLAVPIQRQLGGARKGLHTLALNPAFGSFQPEETPARFQFVRPDCPPDSKEDTVTSSYQKQQSILTSLSTGTAAAYTADKPKFRSALEQVSWMTNNLLKSEEAKPSKAHKGLLGKLGL